MRDEAGVLQMRVTKAMMGQEVNPKENPPTLRAGSGEWGYGFLERFKN